MPQKTSETLTGSMLVALQFILLILLAGLAVRNAGTPPFDAWLLIAAGMTLGLWAVVSNPPGNFNIRPTPKAGGRLITAGPYRVIRHPMYAALLLAGAGTGRMATHAAAWACLVALAAVLVAKAIVEERALRQTFPDYAAYCARTWRILPGLF
jgi:protein-S-isoprenylcysteine O-methyltransferase Ste14